MPILIHTGPSPHSGHRIDKYIRCPQRWAYEQIVPRPLPGRTQSPALIKGSLVHVGLAHHYRRMQATQEGDDPTTWWEPMRAIEVRAAQEGGSWPRFVTEAQDAVCAYLRFWGVETFRVVGVEVNYQFEVTWKERTWPVTRSADLVIENVNGRKLILDHKTAGTLDTRTIERYRLSGQFLDYARIGQEQWGDAFDGAYLNFLTWNGKMKRYRVPAAPAAVESRKDQVIMAHVTRATLLEHGVDLWDFPKRLHEQVCNGPYGLCDAVELCAWGKAAAQAIDSEG